MLSCKDIFGWLQVGLYLVFCRCICFNSCFKKKSGTKAKLTVKALVLGLPASGKTRFAKNFLALMSKDHSTPSLSTESYLPADSSEFLKYEPTKGFVIHKEIWYREFKMNFTEIGGSFQKYWKRYTKDSQGLLYLVNISTDIKPSIDALETFAVGNHDVRSWPICILATFVDKKQLNKTPEEVVLELERYINTRHMLKAWLPNMYVSKTSNCFGSDQSFYSVKKAEEDLKNAMDFLCVGIVNGMIESHYKEIEKDHKKNK